MESLIYRGPKPQGFQKIGRLEAHPEATCRLTTTSMKATLIKIPKRHMSQEHWGNSKRHFNPSTPIRTQVPRLKRALQGPSTYQSTCHSPQHCLDNYHNAWSVLFEPHKCTTNNTRLLERATSSSQPSSPLVACNHFHLTWE